MLRYRESIHNHLSCHEGLESIAVELWGCYRDSLLWSSERLTKPFKFLNRRGVCQVVNYSNVEHLADVLEPVSSRKHIEKLITCHFTACLATLSLRFTAIYSVKKQTTVVSDYRGTVIPHLRLSASFLACILSRKGCILAQLLPISKLVKVFLFLDRWRINTKQIEDFQVFFCHIPALRIFLAERYHRLCCKS